MGLSKELGTRHRAAVGMSEVSDALIIVVSEENGKVSVAQGGVLDRAVTREELREKLTYIQMCIRDRDQTDHGRRRKSAAKCRPWKSA